MKTKIPSQPGFLGPRLLMALLFCASAALTRRLIATHEHILLKEKST